MKLKNKQTGEIGNLNAAWLLDTLTVETPQADMPNKIVHYNSLAELNTEWEDYEEPVKPYWFINDLDGEPMKCDLKNCGKSNFTEWSKHRKEIGNYFSSIAEAEKAVEKLKAWKRLKDKGFRFDGYDVAHNSNGDLCGQLFYNAGKYCIGDVEKDLDLLFSGEDD